jgi:hypothetical protein
MEAAHNLINESGLKIFSIDDLQNAAEKAVQFSKVVKMGKFCHLFVPSLKSLTYSSQPVTSTSVSSSLSVSKRQMVWLCSGRIVPFRRLICRQSITVDCIYLARFSQSVWNQGTISFSFFTSKIRPLLCPIRVIADARDGRKSSRR